MTVQHYFDRRREAIGLLALFGRRSNSSHYTELCSLWVEARSDATQWVIVITKAVNAMVVHVAIREAVEVLLVTETVFIEVEVVVVDAATAMSIEPACYSVA